MKKRLYSLPLWQATLLGGTIQLTRYYRASSPLAFIVIEKGAMIRFARFAFTCILSISVFVNSAQADIEDIKKYLLSPEVSTDFGDLLQPDIKSMDASDFIKAVQEIAAAYKNNEGGSDENAIRCGASKATGGDG